MRYPARFRLSLAACPPILALLLASTALPCLAAPEWNADEEIRQLQEEIRQNGWTWTAGHTGVSDLTPAEKQAMLGLVPMNEEERRARSSGEVIALPERDLPASYDWRSLGGMTGVRNQGGCGSCWAFAPTAAFESMIKIYKGVDTNLSEQQILVCNEMGGSCDGGQSEAAYFVQMTMGQVSETSMPYTGNDTAPCNDDEYDSVEYLQGYQMVPNIIANLKTAILTGPIAVNLYAPNSLFYYTDGCYQYTGSGQVNHCVTLCGWDDNACSGQGAWLFKNSWGPSWGEGGYGWMRYGDCYLGQGANLINYTPSLYTRLGFDAVTVSGGNNNGVLDPGETGTLQITLRNFGRTAGTGVSATLSCANPAITIIDGTATFPNIIPGAQGVSVAPHFQVLASGGAAGSIPFTLTIACSEEDSQTSTFPLFIGPTLTVYEQGFEASDGGWTHGGTVDDWRRATPRTKYSKPDPVHAASGLYCFGNDLNETGSYNTLYENNANSYLESPVINCSGRTGVRLSFRRFLTVEEGLYDHGRLKVNGTEIFGNPTNGNFRDTGWETLVYDISSIADNNPSVRVRFETTSDGGLRFGGWAVDDIRIFVPDTPAADAQEAMLAPAALGLAAVPNPFNPVTTIRLAVPSPGGTPEVSILDPSGRRVGSIDTGRLAPGIHTFEWSGRDDAGRPLASGVYFVRAALGSESTVHRLVILR